MFKEFKSKTKAEWLAKVKQDLKGKSIEDLDWEISHEYTFSPFAHQEDLVEVYPPIHLNKNN